MADITLCKGGACPKRDSCLRFTAPPDKNLQSYFMNPPIDEKGVCAHYWPNKFKEKGFDDDQ